MSEKPDLKKMLDELQAKIPSGVCCVCGHPLSSHIDEGEGFRCHFLGQDFFQCECFLRKGRYPTIHGYDLKKRAMQYVKEEFEDRKERQ